MTARPILEAIIPFLSWGLKRGEDGRKCLERLGSAWVYDGFEMGDLRWHQGGTGETRGYFGKDRTASPTIA